MTSQVADGMVEFRLYRPNAGNVWLAGDFNGWNHHETPMRREPSGHWTCTLELPPGSYQFRYFVDGGWLTDCAAFGLQPGPYGWNSVVYIGAPVAA
jgi:1,4-alpha-glucan branching enzyme